MTKLAQIKCPRNASCRSGERKKEENMRMGKSEHRVSVCSAHGRRRKYAPKTQTNPLAKRSHANSVNKSVVNCAPRKRTRKDMGSKNLS